MIGRSGERGPVRSVLAAHDDNDMCVCVCVCVSVYVHVNSLVV